MTSAPSSPATVQLTCSPVVLLTKRGLRPIRLSAHTEDAGTEEA